MIGCGHPNSQRIFLQYLSAGIFLLLACTMVRPSANAEEPSMEPTVSWLTQSMKGASIRLDPGKGYENSRYVKEVKVDNCVMEIIQSSFYPQYGEPDQITTINTMTVILREVDPDTVQVVGNDADDYWTLIARVATDETIRTMEQTTWYYKNSGKSNISRPVVMKPSRNKKMIDRIGAYETNNKEMAVRVVKLYPTWLSYVVGQRCP